MSRAIDRHRARRDGGDVSVYGDGDGGTAGMALSAFSELASRGAAVAKAEQDKKDAAAAKAKADASSADAVAAQKAAADARHKAQVAAIDAKTAMAQADAVEKDPNGPQHQAAKKKADEAALLDAEASGLEAKAALYGGGGGAGDAARGGKGGAAPSKSWLDGIKPVHVAAGVGGLVAVALLWRALGRKR